MPFPMLYGIPKDTPTETLSALRKAIVEYLSENMPDVPAHYVRPFFPSDLLGDPVVPEDGGETIYVALDTGMMHDKPDADVEAPKLLRGLADLIWGAFEGKYEVEAFVRDLNPKHKALVSAKPQVHR